MAYGCMLYELTGISVKKLVIIMACEKTENVLFMKSATKQNTSSYYKSTLEIFLTTNWRHMPSKIEDEFEKALEKKFFCPAKFAQEIEFLVRDNKDMNYIDAIIYFCECNAY